MENNVKKCSHCGSENVVDTGIRGGYPQDYNPPLSKPEVLVYECKDCGESVD